MSKYWGFRLRGWWAVCKRQVTTVMLQKWTACLQLPYKQKVLELLGGSVVWCEEYEYWSQETRVWSLDLPLTIWVLLGSNDNNLEIKFCAYETEIM